MSGERKMHLNVCMVRGKTVALCDTPDVDPAYCTWDPNEVTCAKCLKSQAFVGYRMLEELSFLRMATEGKR